MNNPHQALATAGEHFDAGRLDEAEAIYRKLLALQPRNDGLLRMLGLIARRREQFAEAERLLSEAVRVAPDNHLNHFELGNIYIKLQRELDALPHFLRATELKPQLQPAYTNAGAVLERAERYDEALPWCRRAIELQPNCPIAHYNLGNVLRELGDIDAALRCFERSIELNAEGAKAHWNSAFCYLAQGRFAEGWREYEWRQAAGEVQIDRYTQPRWQGEPLTGRRLLVHGEQGIGDEVLFASCLPELIAQAEHVTVVCEPRLSRLFARSFPTAAIYPWQRVKNWAPAPVPGPVELQIPAGSVPLYLRSSAAAFPRRTHYLQADPVAVERWRGQLRALGAGLKVGISWQAGGQPVERRRRTTSLGQWQGIFATPDTQFISLQYGEASGQVAQARSELGVTIHQFEACDPLVDLDDFAALVCAVDLVISVGNATVHLAGALGQEAWALLPLVPSWRWMSGGEESVWYSSVRLVRQTRRGDWEPVFQRIQTMLNDKVSGRDTSASAWAPAPRAGQAIPPAAPPVPARLPAAESVRGPATAAGRPRRGLTIDDRGDVVIVKPDTTATGVAAEGAPLPPVSATQFAPALPRAAALPTPSAGPAAASRTPTVPTSSVDAFDQGASHAVEGLPAVAESWTMARLGPSAASGAADTTVSPIANLAATSSEGLGSFLHTSRIPEVFEQARAMFQRNDLAGAEALLQEILEHTPRHATASHLMGVIARRTGRAELAARLLKRALSAAPGDVQIQCHLGDALKDLGQYDEAVAAYRRSMELAPTYVEPVVNLANVLRRQGHLAEAREQLNAALRLDPHHAPAYNALGALALEAGRLDEASVAFEAALRDDPHCLAALNNLGRTLLLAGRPDEAVRQLRRALEIAPADCLPPLQNLASALEALGQIDAALEVLGRALQLAPRDPELVEMGQRLAGLRRAPARPEPQPVKLPRGMTLHAAQAVVPATHFIADPDGGGTLYIRHSSAPASK